jgi:hypothetical protein
MRDDERPDASDRSHHGDDELRVKPDRRQRHELRFRGQDGRRAEDRTPEPGLEDEPDPTSKG